MAIKFDPHGIAEQRKACDAATPGPWEKNGFYDNHVVTAIDGRIVMVCMAETRNDARFIASARTGWPAALDSLEAARAENAALREQNARLTAERDAAIECIPKTCVNCAKRYGWDTCKEPAFISDGNECLNFFYGTRNTDAPEGTADG